MNCLQIYVRMSDEYPDKIEVVDEDAYEYDAPTTHVLGVYDPDEVISFKDLMDKNTMYDIKPRMFMVMMGRYGKTNIDLETYDKLTKFARNIIVSLN